MFKIKTFYKFINENYTFQDLKFGDEILQLLIDLKKEGVIDEYWVEEGSSLSMDDNRNVTKYIESGVPNLKISLRDDDHVYSFDKHDKLSCTRFLNTLKHNSIYVPREEVESIREIMLLIKDGWELFHISENRAEFLLGYRRNGRGGYLYLLGLTFRKIDDKVSVKISTNLNDTPTTRFKLEEIVDKSEVINTAKRLLTNFYKLWTDPII